MALTQKLMAYVDERGNTGDVTLPADGAPPHADQPIFVLAAVLVPEACRPAFEAEVQGLNARHGILDQELKAAHQTSMWVEINREPLALCCAG